MESRITEETILMDLLVRLEKAVEQAKRYNEKFSIITLESALEIAKMELHHLYQLQEIDEFLNNSRKKLGK